LKRRNRCSPTPPAILRTVVAGDDLIRPPRSSPPSIRRPWHLTTPVSRVLSSLETAALTHLFPHSIATWGRHNDYLHRVLRRAGKHANCGQLIAMIRRDDPLAPVFRHHEPGGRCSDRTHRVCGRPRRTGRGDPSAWPRSCCGMTTSFRSGVMATHAPPDGTPS
jgi:hypothetical protein